MKQILIASDHAGFALKAELQKLLKEFKWLDLGPDNANRVDYPDYAKKLGHQLQADSAQKPLGVLICGSGIGMSISANKINGIRAALVENPVSACLAREHNDANVLCLGARFLAPEYAAEITRAFLESKFSADPRHQARVNKMVQLEGDSK